MPEVEDSNGTESAHSLNSEHGELDVPIMRIPYVRDKAVNAEARAALCVMKNLRI